MSYPGRLFVCIAALFLATRFVYCQAANVLVKVILQYHVDPANLDLANSSSSPCSVLGNVTSKMDVTCGQGLSITNTTTRIRQTDGLCQVHFTLAGDAQFMSVCLTLQSLVFRGINGEHGTVAVLFESNARLYKVATDDACDVRRVLQPCDSADECQLGACTPKQNQDITTGNLIVLAYAGACILALILMFLFCFYQVGYKRRRRDKEATASTNQADDGIHNSAFLNHT